MHKQPLDAETHLAAIEEATDIGVFGSRVDVGVCADDHRIAPAQFEGDAFDLTPGHFHHVTTDLCGAGERDAAYAWIAQELLANLAARSGYHVDRPRRQGLLAGRKGGLLDQLDGLEGR